LAGLSRWWPDYAIKPSSYVSGLCYSVLRGEPWTRCGLGCVYCYARWYRGPHGEPGAKPWWRGLWRRLAREAGRAWPRPWFRFSTLSEPVQPRPGAREPAGLTVWALRLAERHGVGVVLNTRSGLVAHPSLLGVLQGLAERGLVVVQVSLSPPGAAAVLEPGAPPVWERLEAVEALAEQGVPVAVRLQPWIPGLDEALYEVAVEALERGAGGLIAEPLRETRLGLQRLYRLLGAEPRPGLEAWEPYELGRLPGREGLLHPPRWWRRRLHQALRHLAARYGAAYASCKDGWLAENAWPPWGPGWGDCCLYTRLSRGRLRGALPLLRPTLHELAHYAARAGDTSWEGFVGYCVERLSPLGYRCGPLLEELPPWLRRPLRVHEAMLRRLWGQKRVEALSRLLGLEDVGELAG